MSRSDSKLTYSQIAKFSNKYELNSLSDITTDKSRSFMNKTNQGEEIKKNYGSQTILQKFLNQNKFLIKSSRFKLEASFKTGNLSNSKFIKAQTLSKKK